MAGVPIELPRIRLARALSVLLAVALLGTSAPSQTPTQTPTSADTVLDVRVTGNETVPTAKVMA